MIPFKPKLYHTELFDELASDRFGDRKRIRNTALYDAVEQLIGQVEPEENKKYIWRGFFVPLRRKGRRITIPFCIDDIRRGYVIDSDGFEQFVVEKGDDRVDLRYFDFLADSSQFLDLLREDLQLPYRTTPYDIRTGRIQRKHVREVEMALDEKERILARYGAYLHKGLQIERISLNEYLETAAIGYRAAYPAEVENMSAVEMYKRFADCRWGGMLDIEDWTSAEQFEMWNRSGRHAGSHPFEVKYSGHNFGIHLRPPDMMMKGKASYDLSLGEMTYVKEFLAMLDAFIDHQIPFEAFALEGVLNKLTGEDYLRVNLGLGVDGFCYFPCRKDYVKYFHKIEWDDLDLPVFKD